MAGFPEPRKRHCVHQQHRKASLQWQPRRKWCSPHYPPKKALTAEQKVVYQAQLQEEQLREDLDECELDVRELRNRYNKGDMSARHPLALARRRVELLNEELYYYAWAAQGHPETFYVYKNVIYDDGVIARRNSYDMTRHDFRGLLFRTASISEARKFAKAAGGGKYEEKFREDLNHVTKNGKTVYEVYTDGACTNNGKDDAEAGVGVYFGENNPMNYSKAYWGDKHTSQRAELQAVSQACHIISSLEDDRKYEVYTDSEYALKSLTEWADKWERNGWKTSSGKPVSNKKEIQETRRLLQSRGCRNITLKKVKGHSDSKGNFHADRLAKEGSKPWLTF